MKDVSEITVCVVDYGTFIDLAEMFSRVAKKTYYHSPCEEEYQGIKKCCIGDGAKEFSRVDDFMDPEILAEIDLFCFPDIGFGGTQRYLRSIGKAVWGSFGAYELELYRTRFLKVIKDLGLTVAGYEKIIGVTKLSDHLKKVKNKWVKINRYRDDMETWHHIDYPHSISELDRLAIKFGGLKENPVFIVQDALDGAVEIGYDGLSVDGRYPKRSFSGYEQKNELYLGSLLDYQELAEPIRVVNEAMAPVLEKSGYRNFVATELRVMENGETHFTDPTLRQAGQTMEHQYETCTNLPKVIWKGANGELIEQEFKHDYAAEATLHYTAGNPEDWKIIKVPDKVRPMVKLYRYCESGGFYHFPPAKNNEVGVVCGSGNSIKSCLKSLKTNFDIMKDEPLSINFEKFAGLLKEIDKAEDEGMEFSDDPIPDPSIVL